VERVHQLKQTKPFGKSIEQAARERRAANSGRRNTDNPPSELEPVSEEEKSESTYTRVERRVEQRRKPAPAPKPRAPAYVYVLVVVTILWLFFTNVPDAQIAVNQTFSPDADMKCVKGRIQFDSWTDRLMGQGDLVCTEWKFSKRTMELPRFRK